MPKKQNPFQFMTQVAKKTGLSLEEAKASFKAFADSLRFTPHNPTIWSERMLEETKDETSFFAEYQQQPLVDNASTFRMTGTGLTPDEDAIERRQEEITQELSEAFEMPVPDFEMPVPDLVNVDTCPHCMRRTTWSLRDYENQAECDECNWVFDSWALANVPFNDMRTQVLEMKLRQQEQQLEQARNQQNLDRQLEQARETVAAEPTGPPDNTNMDIADEVRTLLSHRNLTANQMRRLNELIGIVQNSPPPPLQSHPDDYAGELDQQRSRQRRPPRPRRLTGSGVSGDQVLQGNEENLMFFDESAEPWIDDREKEKPKEKPIRPLDPLKRKLDI